jgi:ABC-2 type transport system permease protein
MVAHLVRLKLTLLANIFRRNRAQAVGAVLGILYFGGLVVLAAVGVALLRSSLDDARLIIPLGGAAAIVLWTFVPLLAFGSDPTLDPQRFATFAVPQRQLATGLVVAGALGLPGLATMVLAAATIVAWSHSVLSTLVAVVAACAGVLTCVTLSRWVSALATAAVSSRRGRDVAGVVGVLLLVALGPVSSVLDGVGNDLEGRLGTISTIVSWTPLGWVWAAPGDVAAGDLPIGLLRLVLATGFLGGLWALWVGAVRRQVEDPRLTTASGGGGSRTGLGLFARFPDTPWGAIAARSATYWLRDPRYQIALVLSPVVPLLLLGPFIAGDVAWVPLLMAPLLAFLLGFGEHNSVAYESTAFWQHVAAGVRGRDDRLGRLVPSLLLAAVLVPAYAVLGTSLAGRLDLLPAVLGLSVALLGATYAVSSVLSVSVPYPVPKPGDSPFSTPPGATGVTLLAQTIAGAATVILVSPVLLLAWLTWSGSTWAPWATALGGVALGVVLGLVGVRAGAAVFERRAPEVLADLAAS